MGSRHDPGRRRALVAISIAAAALAAVPAAASGPAGTPALVSDRAAGGDATVGLHGVTSPPYERNSTIEPSIASDPADPRDAVAAYHEGRDPGGGAADIGYATTKDGGLTWTSGNLPGLTTAVDPGSPFNHASDPVVAFGPDHLVYVSTLLLDESTDGQGTVNQAGLGISVSKDGGSTWENPVVMHLDNADEVQNVGLFDDKNWVTVDMGTGPGHHLGRVYVVWDIQEVILYAYCDPDNPAATTPGCDEQGNWSPTPNQARAGTTSGFGVAYGSSAIGSYPLVLQNGDLEIVFNDEGAALTTTSSAPQFAEVTTAGPAGSVPWPAPLTFPTVETVIAPDDATTVRLQRAGPDLPTAGVDPVTGRVAVGWAGTTFRSAGDVLNDPEVTISSDATGQSFGKPVRVDAGAPTDDHVDRYDTMLGWGSDGSLRIAYRQRQEAVDEAAMSQTIDTYYQQSADQGATFSTPLKLDTQPTDVGYCAFSRGGCFEGDYDELAPAGDTTYVVREEAYAATAGEPYNNVNGHFDVDNGHINQHPWVAVVGPQPQTDVPESPAMSVLAVIGGGVAVIAGLRRRRGDAGDEEG